MDELAFIGRIDGAVLDRNDDARTFDQRTIGLDRAAFVPGQKPDHADHKEGADQKPGKPAFQP